MSAKTGKQYQFGQYMTYLTTICSLKSFHANFMVLEISVAHVTYRATVIATLHVGPHECKTGKQCQFGQGYDVSYHNMQSKKVSMQISWY